MIGWRCKHESNLDYTTFIRMFRVTPLQYAEMNDKMELASFIRKEQKRLDIAMGKESDIARVDEVGSSEKTEGKIEKGCCTEEARREKEGGPQ